MAGVLGFSPFQVGIYCSVGALVPVLLLPSFTKISALSLVGCVSTVIVVVTLIGTVAADPTRKHMPDQVRGLEHLSWRQQLPC